MAQSCIPPDPSRAKYGFATPVVEAIKRYLGRTPTTGDMRNVLRNLGVDDARALDLKRAGSNKKFFGRNIDEIKEWNPNKGSVPSQTIVKKAMPDGSVRHYMSRQKTSLEPTRWVESDGKIMPNPDWDMVGENVTFGDGIPQLYVRTGKATYRRAEAGEDGVFLNIQRPHRGENLSRDQILDMEVDAFEISPGNYRLVHESTQAIDPQRVAERQSRDAFFKYSEKANPSQRELDEIADEAGIGRPIGYTLGGAMLGGALDDEGNEGAWLGGALGAMLGSRRMRSVVKKSFTGRKSKDLDQHAIDIDNLEAEQALNREIVGEGYAGRLDDVEEKKRFIDHVLTPIKAAREGGRGIANLILNNPVLGSGFSVFMQAKNSPTAKKLYGIMERSAAAPNTMYRRYSENLVEQFGERGWREASARQVNEIRRIMGDESISEEEALDRFGETIFRAITYRADVEDGVLRYDSRGNRVYANDDLRQMDEAIMATDTGRRMKRALQDTFDGIADNQIEALNTHTMTIVREVLDGHIRADAELFVAQSLPFKQWVATLNDKSLKQRLNSYRDNPDFNQVIEQHNKKVSIESMKGSYFPQIFSDKKAARDFRRFINTREMQDATAHERNLAYWRARNLNMADFHHSGGRMLEVNSEGTDVITRRFNSYKQAVNALRSEADNITDDAIRNQVLRDINSNVPSRLDQYIGREMVDGQNTLFLQNPEFFANEGINIMRDINTRHFERANSIYLGGTHVKRSNHLDRARETIMPANMIETNIDQVMRTYSNDVAPRLHFLQNNLATKADLNRTFKKIKEELSGTMNPKTMERLLGRMETWWNITQNGNDFIPVGLSPDQQARLIEKRSTARKVMQGLSNFATVGFLYFTSSYSFAQPFLLAPFFGSWRQTKNAYRKILADPQVLRRMTDELEMAGIFDKQRLGTYNVTVEGSMRDMIPSDDMSRLDSFYEFSQKVVGFASELSFTKMALKHTNIDLENGGILRTMVGNLMDISAAEAGISTLAVFRHVEDLVAAGRMLNEGATEARVGGRLFRRGQVERQLQDLGIVDVDNFIANKEKFNGYVRRLEGEEFDMRKAFDTEQEYLDFYDQITTMMNTIVDQYHGRNKFSRPEMWVNNPYGQSLARFSSYSQNFGIRVVRQRMYQPLKDWVDNYKMGDLDNTSLFKVAFHMSNNNERALRNIFGVQDAFDGVQTNKDLAERFLNSRQRRDRFIDSLSEADYERYHAAYDDDAFRNFVDTTDKYIQAYDEFPTEAVHNIFKVLPALGVGKAMMMTRGAMVDLLGIATNEALGNDDYEAWRALNRQWVINPQSRQEDQRTFGDLFADDITGYDMMNLFRHGLYMASDTGFAGRIGQIALDQTRYPTSGLMGTTPVTSMVDETFQMIGNLASQESAMDLVETAPRELADRILLHTPPVGSFYDMRKGLINGLFHKPSGRGLTGTTPDGIQLNDIEFFD